MRSMVVHSPPSLECTTPIPIAQWIEHSPSKTTVTGSSPVGDAKYIFSVMVAR